MIRDKKIWLVGALLLGLGAAGIGRVAAQQDPGKPADAPKPADKPGDKPADAPKDGATPAPGAKKDDPASGDGTGEQSATTKFIEAFQTQDWVKCETSFKELTDLYPAYRKDPVYIYKYAFSLYKQGAPQKKAEAAEQLQGLLEQDPDHILAMYLLAQVRATQADKPTGKEDAKELLLNAARGGFYTLREIQTSKSKEFDYLKTDPKFILRAMRASQEFNAINSIKTARNPFQLPKISKGNPDEIQRGISLKDLANLELKIEKLFQDIEELIKNKEIDKLAPLFQDLNGIMGEYKKIGVEKVQLKLRQWEKKLDEWKEVRLAIQLQIYINQGNDFLKNMVRARQAEKFEEVFENFAQIKALYEKMKQEEREEFHRNAEAILVRGKALNDEAIKLKKIKEFNLVVTGIVVDPRPESKNRAIIVFDDPDKRGRIYEENDDLRDKDDRKVPGLKVVKITEGAIKFKYEDTEFIRELKAP